MTDFGLARAGDHPAADGRPAAAGDRATAARGDDAEPLLHAATLTETGALVGTPAYMAPEQLGGGESDARSDQFSFCVTAYEALYGERPFAGRTAAELLAAIAAGGITPPRGRIPAWLRMVLVRGLSRPPEDRYRSMNELLLMLGPDRTRTRRLVIGAASVALCAALGAPAAVIVHRSTLCRGSDEQLAGVWDRERKKQIREAFLATHTPYAEAAWRGVEAALDARARRFVAVHRDCCEATRLRGEQSDEVLGLRMACLRGALGEWKSLNDVFARADAGTVERAVSAVQALRPLEACDDDQVLAAPRAAPRDGPVSKRVEEVRAELARAKAEEDVGHLAEARALATAAATAARALRFRPVEAEALYRRGRLERLTGDREAAEQTLQDALDAAQAAGDPRITARAAVELADAVGGDSQRTALGHRWLRHAEAALERAPSDEIAARAELVRSDLLDIEERTLDALAAAQRGVELLTRALGRDHLEVAQATTDVAWTLCGVGHCQEALALADRAGNALERSLGAEHPGLVGALQARAYALKALGRYDEAIADLRRAVAIRERALGPDDEQVAASPPTARA